MTSIRPNRCAISASFERCCTCTAFLLFTRNETCSPKETDMVLIEIERWKTIKDQGKPQDHGVVHSACVPDTPGTVLLGALLIDPANSDGVSIHSRYPCLNIGVALYVLPVERAVYVLTKELCAYHMGLCLAVMPWLKACTILCIAVGCWCFSSQMGWNSFGSHDGSVCE